ncbi:MAG: MGMT family protein [candidate division KSB1 bacterium]|nr:MGMT family protein [candidate division KSB1 bacterium]
MRAGQEGGARRGAFFLGVNEVVSKVPRGRVASYGQLAAPAGMPHAARFGWKPRQRELAGA